MVECQLPKLDVAGSTPVTRSNFSSSAMPSGPETMPLRCPGCGREFPRSATCYPPFCSERCKLLDLDRWLREAYRIPGDPAAPPDTGEPETD